MSKTFKDIRAPTGFVWYLFNLYSKLRNVAAGDTSRPSKSSSVSKTSIPDGDTGCTATGWIRDLNHPQPSSTLTFDLNGVSPSKVVPWGLRCMLQPSLEDMNDIEASPLLKPPFHIFPLDLRCPPVCVKSERPLKQLWVNRWLSVPQRCKDVQSKPPKWTV